MDKLNKPIYILLAILMMALVFRVMLLGLHRMHMDECLYSSYAVRMVTHGDLSLNGGLQVDKPPLFFYSIAASFLINGVSENAARLPNLIMSIISIYLIYLLVMRLYGRELYALLSAAFMGFSVFYTLFSVTAFQDISMIMCFLLALLFMIDRRITLSAVMYGLSIACKPMTIFMGPVYIFFYFITAFSKESIKKDILDMLIGVAYVIVPLILWSGLLANPRWGIVKFFITQQPEVMEIASDYNGRFLKWWSHSRYLLNNYIYLAISFAGTVVVIIFDAVKKDKKHMISGIMFLVSVVYIYALFTIIQFRQYDRYVLMLVPFVSVMLGVVCGKAAELLKNKKAIMAAVIIIMLPYVLYMHGLSNKNISMGALCKDSDGFDIVANYINKQPSKDTKIIYFGHTLSWYGYFYVEESKFAPTESVYDLKAVQLQKKDKRNILVVDTTRIQKGIVDIFRKDYKLLLNVSIPNIKDKYLIFEINQKIIDQKL